MGLGEISMCGRTNCARTDIAPLACTTRSTMIVRAGVTRRLDRRAELGRVASSARNAQGCLDQRLHGGKPALATPDELLKVGDKVGDGRRRWVDRFQAFVNRDESQIDRAGFASLGMPLPFELAQELLGLVFRGANGNGEVLMG